MSQRGSAIVWLILGLFCGVFSLAGCAGGGYGIYHVETTLKTLNERIEEDEKGRSDPHNRGKKLEELEKRLAENDKEEADYKRYRFFAIAGGVLSLIPPVLTLAFLGLAVLKFRKKDEPDDGEADEEPPPKKSEPVDNE